MAAMFDSNSISPASPPAHYQPINPLALTSAVLAVLSIATMLNWFLAVIPLAGIIVGWIALRQIRKAPEEWTGLRLAQVGLALSAALWVFGYGWLILVSTNEVPFGYTAITFADLQPDPAKPTEPVPQTAIDLQDGKVFIKGYMQPRRQQLNIREFILCPSNGDCAFCNPNPRPTEKIRVVLQGDNVTTYTTGVVSVVGRFRVNVNDPNVPYGIDVDVLK
jgi:hypothetical protein